MKVLTVVGARPQFIKAFAVSRALKPEHEELLVHTGQHYDEMLSDVFFQELEINKPDYNLGVGSGSHGQQTGQMLIEIEQLILEEDPDLVLVYGDTNSTLAAAIAASKLNVPLAHVEAGLRSGNDEMPEETNRILTDHASDILFAPSTKAQTQLATEGLGENTHVVGDVMYDSLLWASQRLDRLSEILSELNLEEGKYVLSTVHRAENTDSPDRLESIVDALSQVDRTVVLPAHPRTIDRLKEYNIYETAKDGIQLIEPVGYLDFLRLLDGAEVVATDSGGVQKEAFYLDTPCVTVRDETEWTETVDAGWNVLIGADTARIISKLEGFQVPATKPQPYGDGSASKKIVDILESEMSDGMAPAQSEEEISNSDAEGR